MEVATEVLHSEGIFRNPLVGHSCMRESIYFHVSDRDHERNQVRILVRHNVHVGSTCQQAE